MAKYKSVPFYEAEIENGFWKNRTELNARVTVPAVRDRFEETGRFASFKMESEKAGVKPHIFFDSDVAKWIEAAAYLIGNGGPGAAEYEKFCDELIDSIAAHRRADGYFNSYFLKIEPENTFKNRKAHELYTAGHLIEAAIAYDRATGKRKMLDLMLDFCECIYRAFVTDKTAKFFTPGHEELELALVALYEYTGNKKWLELARHFVTERGGKGEHDNMTYAQDEMPLMEMKWARGHCVRALYYYTGAARVAAEYGDERMAEVLDGLFDDIANGKLYITGGTGSERGSEAFSVAYDLPNSTAYNESCCAIAMIGWCLAMRSMKRDERYGDMVERELFNTLLSSASLDGKAFFYNNPTEIAGEDYDTTTGKTAQALTWLPKPTRSEVFDCSCCPPNIARMFGKISGVIAFEHPGEGVCIEQYLPSALHTSFGEIAIGGEFYKGECVSVKSADYRGKMLSFRIPRWSEKTVFRLGGKPISPRVENGYAFVETNGGAIDLAIEFDIRPRFVYAHPFVRADVGRVALTYGPVVYCLEGVDNGPQLNRITVNEDSIKSARLVPDFHGLFSILLDGKKELPGKSLYSYCPPEKENVTLKFIPYFAFANRGFSDMLVWIRKD